MPYFGKRNLSLIEKIKRSLSNSSINNDRMPFVWEWQERQDQYKDWESLYSNDIYKKQSDGGLREVLIRDVLDREDTSLPFYGFFNPVKSIVDAYQGVFQGTWGKQIRPAEKVGDKEVNKQIIDPLGKIWKWSNLATHKQLLCYYAAALGTVGLRVWAGDEKNRRIRISIEHPGAIIDYDTDNDGNVTDVLLEYSILTGDLGERRDENRSVYRERLNKTEFQRIVDGEVVERVDNALGVCPFVLLQHMDIGQEYGAPSFYGSEWIIHLINWLITRQHIAIDKTIFGKWLLTGSGAAPEEIDFTYDTILYVQTTADDPKPTMEHLKADLDHQRVMEVWEALVAKLKERQPELVLNDLKVRSGQSGESIAQLMKPAEAAINLAKDRYEHALIRAQQIALSWGVVLGMWDLGTGTGAASSADNAYWGGQMDFEYAERPVLPEGIYDEIARAESETKRRNLDIADAVATGDVTSRREKLRIMGYDDQQINRILDEKRTEDVVDDAAAMEATTPEPTFGG